MNSQIAPYPLRLRSGLRRRLQAKADQGDRSLHREIVRRLEASLEIENAPEGQSSEALDSIPTSKRKENEYDPF